MSPNFEKFVPGHVELTETERRTLEEKGGEGAVKAAEEKIKSANEALRKKAGEEAREDLEKDFEGKAA